MKVEIWSDVMCPFCYIGKRRFENALNQSGHKEEIDIVWKSFQLNPQMKTEPTKNINEYLAEIKGWPIEQARKMNAHVTGMAKEEGLEYNFDKAVVANSFDAHRFMQFAKKQGKGDQAEEALFHSHFTEGRNIADHETLVQIGKEIGLPEMEVRNVLEKNLFANEVERDVYEAQQFGIRGVPFFVLNEKYGVSGAQAIEVFSQALKKSFAEWHQSKPLQEITNSDGEVCSPDSNCN